MTQKTCSTCKSIKNIDLFAKCKDKKDGHHCRCKECDQKAYSVYYNNKKTEIVKRKRDLFLGKKYGITYEQKIKMVYEQSGKCMICGETLKIGINDCVDHDHKTGKIRGILCNGCNRGIGFFNDDPEKLELAKNYLLTWASLPNH